MAKDDDIKLIIEQEKTLVFPEFDEAIAFKIGAAMRTAAIAAGENIVVDIRTWDRPLFYMALPGTNGGNQHWVRRKYNVVQRLMKSSYRVTLETESDTRLFPPGAALDPAEFVLAGGGFPIRVKGAGVIGALTVSGLHERDDHRLAVSAICEHLGIAKAPLTLPPL